MTAEALRSTREVDVVILTALAEEKAAVVAALGETDHHQVIRGAGDDVHVASVGAMRIAVASLHGMGNVGASAAAREVIDVWRPRFLVLAGIAAGIRGYAKGLELGDVLVAARGRRRSGWRWRAWAWPWRHTGAAAASCW